LGNDDDPDGDPADLYGDAFTPPEYGSLAVNDEGNLVYTPPPGFTGTDTFAYTITDGQDVSNEATVTITVGDVAPPAEGNAVPGWDCFGTDVDSDLTITDTQLLANDFDPDGDPITVAITGTPEHGSLLVNGDGTYTYTPDDGYVGEDTFTYALNDGTADSLIPGQVTINVGGPANTPATADPDFLETATDTPLTITSNDLTGNDSDTDGPDTIAAFIAAGPTAHGTLVANGDGTYTYTPNTGYQGTDTFYYTAYDGQADSTPTLITITINDDVVVPPGNAAPVPGYDSFGTPIDTDLTITDTDLLANDFDAEDDTLTVTITTQPDHGLVVDNGDGTYTYTPETGYDGLDEFHYQLNDGTQNGVYAGHVIINVGGPANTAATTTPDDLATDANTDLSFTIDDLLGDDTDPDGPDALTSILLSGPTHGSLLDNGDGTLTYTPETDFQGVDTFYYAAYDGISDSTPTAVTITVGTQM
ncbi:MAG: hypothetical protein QOF88_5393, partial [Mycobacterium sp.]|nr:hypothetical protein [Mycobacterium sp.]